MPDPQHGGRVEGTNRRAVCRRGGRPIRKRFRSAPKTSENPVFVGKMAIRAGRHGSENGWVEPETAGSACTSGRIPPTLPRPALARLACWFLPRGTASPAPSHPVFGAPGAPRPATRSRAQPTKVASTTASGRTPVVSRRADRGQGVQRRGRARPTVAVTPGEPRHQLCHLSTAPTSGTSRGAGRIATATGPSRRPTPPSSRWRGRRLGATDGGNGRRRIFAILIRPLPAVPRRGPTAPGTLARKGMILCRERRRQPRRGPAPRRGFAALLYSLWPCRSLDTELPLPEGRESFS